MPAPHSHDAFEETIYGLEGVTTWRVGGQTVESRPGEAFCIPRGAIHGFDNHGTEDAKFLAVASPGVMRPDYFREIHDVLTSNAGGPPDLAKVAEVMRRHGLTPAPPASSTSSQDAEFRRSLDDRDATRVALAGSSDAPSRGSSQ